MGRRSKVRANTLVKQTQDPRYNGRIVTVNQGIFSVHHSLVQCIGEVQFNTVQYEGEVRDGKQNSA